MKKHFKWSLPLLFVIALSPWTPKIDLAIAHFFYTPSLEGKGVFVNNIVTAGMYQYGERMGFAVWGLSIAFFFLAGWKPSLKKYRKGALALILTFILGAGLIVNLGLKEYWGRPRPKQVEDFGGEHRFRPFYQPNFDSERTPQKSFPSGHATTGFYYLTFCLIALRYRSRWLMGVGIVLTVLMGIGLSLTRIAQGGHFFSDTLFSALIMWMTALFIDWLLFEWIPRLTHEKTYN